MKLNFLHNTESATRSLPGFACGLLLLISILVFAGCTLNIIPPYQLAQLELRTWTPGPTPTVDPNLTPLPDDGIPVTGLTVLQPVNTIPVRRTGSVTPTPGSITLPSTIAAPFTDTVSNPTQSEATNLPQPTTNDPQPQPTDTQVALSTKANPVPSDTPPSPITDTPLPTATPMPQPTDTLSPTSTSNPNPLVVEVSISKPNCQKDKNEAKVQIKLEASGGQKDYTYVPEKNFNYSYNPSTPPTLDLQVHSADDQHWAAQVTLPSCP